MGRIHCLMSQAEMCAAMEDVAAAIEAVLPMIKECRERHIKADR